MGRNATGFALKGMVLVVLAGAAGGCILPVPTIPLRLPAHGHTYHVKDAEGRPVREGILVVHTYYHYHEHTRIDCYPIRNGQAVVPTAYDVRVTGDLMFGYFSMVVPTYYMFFINAHHAHVYPFVPGHVPWEGFSPSINDGQHIFGVKPRPEVLRVFPVDASAELTHLLDAGVWGDFRRILSNAERYRKEGKSNRYVRHNEKASRQALEYIDARIKVLSRPPTLKQALAEPSPQEKP